jgi:hypothetical protein
VPGAAESSGSALVCNVNRPSVAATSSAVTTDAAVRGRFVTRPTRVLAS